MKKMSKITLTHRRFIEEFQHLAYGIDTQSRSEFYFPLEDGFGFLSAFNFKSAEWEHVMLDLSLQQRCPSYKEMCQVKDMFWDENEITLQVHPPQSEYVNIVEYALHLWRYKNIYPSTEKKLKKKIKSTYEECKKYYQAKKAEILIEDDAGKKLIIFGGNSWPSWEEVCKLKQKYWQAEEAAIQYNISYNIDLNDEHMIILWDATDFELPPKELV